MVCLKLSVAAYNVCPAAKALARLLRCVDLTESFSVIITIKSRWTPNLCKLKTKKFLSYLFHFILNGQMCVVVLY